MKHGMPLCDLLDLEWFLELDRQADPAETLKRDRRLGLEAQGESVVHGKAPLASGLSGAGPQRTGCCLRASSDPGLRPCV